MSVVKFIPSKHRWSTTHSGATAIFFTQRHTKIFKQNRGLVTAIRSVSIVGIVEVFCQVAKYWWRCRAGWGFIISAWEVIGFEEIVENCGYKIIKMNNLWNSTDHLSLALSTDGRDMCSAESVAIFCTNWGHGKVNCVEITVWSATWLIFSRLILTTWVPSYSWYSGEGWLRWLVPKAWPPKESCCVWCRWLSNGLRGNR